MISQDLVDELPSKLSLQINSVHVNFGLIAESLFSTEDDLLLLNPLRFLGLNEYRPYLSQFAYVFVVDRVLIRVNLFRLKDKLED